MSDDTKKDDVRPEDVKPAAKVTTEDVEKAKAGDTAADEATPEHGSVMDREDVGAAADPEGPDVVHVITEVNPGTAN